MADHLSYIKIRGLEGDPEECFQGLGISGESTSPGGTTSLEWGEIPTEALEALNSYTGEIQAWLQAAAEYDPDSGARDLLPALPLVPAVIGTVVSGGTALPAIATVFMGQILMNLVGTALQSFAENLDENSPRNLFKKAFLYSDPSDVNTLKSILGKATLYLPEDGQIYQSVLDDGLMYDIAIDGATEHHSVLKDKLEDLSLVDVTLKYADNTNLSVKGKVLRR